MSIKITSQEIEEIKRLRRNGFTLGEIWKKVPGFSQGTIQNHMKNVKMSRSGKERFEKRVREQNEKSRLLAIEKNRLKDSEVKKIKQLRKKGYSFYEIAKVVGRNHDVAWRKAKNIKMSPEGKERYEKKIQDHRERNAKLGGLKALEMGCLKKAWKASTKKIKKQPKELSSEKVRLIAHLMFDGCVYTGTSVVTYYNKNMSLINQFSSDFEKIYGLKCSLEKRNDANRTYCYSKLAVKDLLKYTPSYSTAKSNNKIPTEIMESRDELKIIFLRAFWDDEGCVRFSPSSQTRQLNGYSNNLRVLKQIQKLCLILEILI